MENKQLEIGTPIISFDIGTTCTTACITRVGSETGQQEIFIPGELSPKKNKTNSSLLIKPKPNVKEITCLDQIEVSWFGTRAEEIYYNELFDEQENLILCKNFKVHLQTKDHFDTLFYNHPTSAKIKISIIFAEAFRIIRESALDILFRQSEKIISPFDVIWVLSIPIVFSDGIKIMMRKAAYDAHLIDYIGSENFKLCFAPEAACLTAKYCHNSGDNFQELMNQIGIKFVVADCGGGTFNLASYEITNNDPFTMREIAPQYGKNLGSIAVDREFLNFIQEFLGEESYFILKTEKNALIFDFLQQWETIKTSCARFELYSINLGNIYDDEDLKIDELPQLVHNYNQRFPKYPLAYDKKKIKIPNQLIEHFFHMPIDSVSKCMENYLETVRDQDVAYIFLIGGFFRSPILKDYVTKQFSLQYQVIDLAYSEVAIVQGAAIFAVRPETISSHKAQRTYGIKATETYNPAVSGHLERKLQTKRTRLGRLLDIFHIHVRKGEAIPYGTKMPQQFYLPLYEQETELIVEIFASDAVDVKYFDEPNKEIEKIFSFTIPIDESLPFEERCYGVEFEFGHTEIIVRVFHFSQSEPLKTVQLNV